MPRVKKIQGEIMLSKENRLIFPTIMNKAGITPSVLGNRVVVTLLRKIDSALREVISSKHKRGEWVQQSLFDTQAIQPYLSDNGSIGFDIRMDEIVSNRKEYQFAFDTICKIGDIKVFVPIFNDDKKENRILRTSLFDVEIPQTAYAIFKWRPNVRNSEVCQALIANEHTKKLDDGWYESRTLYVDYKKMSTLLFNIDESSVQYRYQRGAEPCLGIVMKKSVGECLFDLQKPYGYILDKTSMMSVNKYFGPIYHFIASNKMVRRKFTIEYNVFRMEVCALDIKDESEGVYSDFKSFKRFVLNPCMEEMKDLAERDLSDCWFEYAPIYEHGRANVPDLLEFTIYNSNLGKRIDVESTKNRRQILLEKRLVDHFFQTKSQSVYIVSKINEAYWTDFEHRLDRLEADIQAGNVEAIENKQAYFNRAFCNYVNEVDRDIRRDPDKRETYYHCKQIMEQEAKKPVCNSDSDKWPAFIEAIHTAYGNQENASWIDAMRFAAQTPRTLTIAIPSQTYKEMFIDPNIDILQSSANTVYVCKMSLKFKA